MEKAIEAGCNKYIAKPENITTLNNLIKKTIYLDKKILIIRNRQ